MEKQRRMYDNLHWYISDITHQIVAKTGIPSDRHHIGKIILKCLQDAPDFLSQIDGGANKSETNASLLKRVVQCATALTKLGLVKGDVMVLMAPGHIDLCIPLYAALCLGLNISPMDWNLTEKELSATFSVTEPKLIFCQSNHAMVSHNATKNLNIDTHIITFDEGDNWMNFSQFLDKYADKTMSISDFRPNDFDPEDTVAFMMPTSGTTGLPKSAMVTHKNIMSCTPHIYGNHTTFPMKDSVYLIFSPLQWMTAVMATVMGPILGFTRLHTSQVPTAQHIYDLAKKYKPSWVLMSPTFATTLLKTEFEDMSVFTCFKAMMFGGSAITPELLTYIKNITPNTDVMEVYGMTELSGLGFDPFSSPLGSMGNRQGNFEYRIVDPETKKDINEPKTPGELWLKGPSVFKGYYKNEAATKETFADGDWFRTGDLVYRDDLWNFYFVDRVKLLLKYKSHHISPVELESLILQHPGVLDTAVSSRPDPECGDLAIACVVRKSGAQVSANDIKDLVKNTLTASKHLRGVIFLDALPLTSTGKVDRKKLKEIVATTASE